MASYHISPATGRPNLCRATKRGCPLGVDTHYGSKDEARAAYEAQNKRVEVPASLTKATVPPTPWHEVPLTEAEEQERQRLAKQSYIYDEETRTRYQRLSARSIWAGTVASPRSWAPVPTDRELDQMEANLSEELYGYSLRDLLAARDIGEAEVRAAEANGTPYIHTKVPSYYEVSIPTDLVRRELGMKQRPKTSADRTDLRRAELDLIEAEASFYGRVMDEDAHRIARTRVDEASKKVKALRDRAVIEKVKSSMISRSVPGAQGPYTSFSNSRGREVGTVVQSQHGFTVMATGMETALASHREPSREFVGTYATEDLALDALAARVRYTFNY